VYPAITVAGRTPRMDPIPAVGEHTEQILAWLRQDQTAAASNGAGQMAGSR
jgi:hypothetical protein